LFWFHPELFQERVTRRWIVDGHGDLRPEHIFLGPPPQIIDCLEFSEEYRHLDVADEMSFLAMECERLGASSLGQELLDRCQNELSDGWPQEMIDFYKSYRACVRAKVTALRSTQLNGVAKTHAQSESIEYLDLAERYAITTRTLLILVGGLMGTGKSTLATALGDLLGSMCCKPTRSGMRCSAHPTAKRSAGKGFTAIIIASLSTTAYSNLLRSGSHNISR
jgi:hypothetical protein